MILALNKYHTKGKHARTLGSTQAGNRDRIFPVNINNWPLQPFSQFYDRPSYTTYAVCVT